MMLRRALLGMGLCASLAACSAILGIGDLPASDDATQGDASGDAINSGDGSNDDGAVGDGGANPNAPRLLAPLSTSRVTTNQPILRWINPAGVTNVMVDLCSDRACTSPTSAPVTGNSYPIPPGYSPGVVFWRVRNGSATSFTWEFNIGIKTTTLDGGAPIDSSWGTTLDVNGDGYADLAVGSDTTGLISLFYGSGGGISAQSDGGTPPSISFSVAVSGASYGILSGGDLNGDGYGDLVVNLGGTTGQVLIYLGSATGVKSTPSITLDAPAGSSSGFGGIAASAGDVNRDGYADLLVGTSAGIGITGFVYLYLGNPSGVAATPATTLVGGNGEPTFGATLTAGDTNGDGYSDVVVGQPGIGTFYQGGGGFLFLGGPTGLNDPNDGGAAAPAATIAGGPHSHFGATMAAADYNGDGYVDLAIQASGFPGAIFYGGPVALDGGVSATAGIAASGSPYASAGDIDGNGYSDLVLTTYDGINIAYGSAAGLSDSVTVLTDPNDGGSGYGVSITSGGDLAKNGLASLLVGAPTAAGGGRAYIYTREPLGGLNTSPLPILIPTTPGANQFGGHVGGATN